MVTMDAASMLAIWALLGRYLWRGVQDGLHAGSGRDHEVVFV